MKKLSTLAILLLLAPAFSAQEVIFESGFESWTDDQPDNWFGIRTNLPQSGVEQVTDDVYEGDHAVRLIRTQDSHQRFTTQDLPVVDGQGYVVSFWVRGEGQIRLGLYDGRDTGSGYAPYNPQGFVTITGNTWQEVVLSINAANDAADAQFILSIQNTVAPEHLVVDDVTITAESLPTVLIHDIQSTTDPEGASPLLGQTVLTGGIVTATLDNGFFMQNGGGPWSGIFVFTTQVTPAIGDSVRFFASVVEFDFPGFEPLTETQLSNVSDFEVVNSGNTLVTTPVTTADVNTEPYEGVLVTVSSATCTNPDAGFGQFLVDDGSGACRVGDLIFDYNAMLNVVYDVTGPVKFSNQEYRILPRSNDDVDVVTSIDPNELGSMLVYPNPANDQLWLELPTITGRVDLVLADATGRLVRQAVLTENRHVVDVADLAHGTYVLTLRSAQGQWSTRVVITR